MDMANARIGRERANSRNSSVRAAKATTSTPRIDTICAIGIVCSSRKNWGQLTIAVAMAKTTVTRIPSSRSTSSTLKRPPGKPAHIAPHSAMSRLVSR